MPPREVLSLVEHGWRGARECSLVLVSRGIPVTHLIKGSLDPQVLALIEPRPGIRVRAVPRRLFRVRLWLTLAARTLGARPRWLLVDNERTLRAVARWCAWRRVTPVLIEPDGNGYRLSVHRRAATLDEVFTLGLQARSGGNGAGTDGRSASRSGGR